jgi:hypothetical protein
VEFAFMHANAQRNPGASPSELPIEFREELRRRFKTEMGFAIAELGKLDVFRELRAAPWAVWQYVAQCWRLNPDSWPSQATIGKHTRYDERTVRTCLKELIGLGLLRVSRREHVWSQRHGTVIERVYYVPGPVALLALEAWAARWPKGEDAPEARPARVTAIRPTLAPLPDRGSGGLPDRGSAEPHSSRSLTFSPQAEPRPLPPPAIAGELVAALPSGQENTTAASPGLERPTPIRSGSNDPERIDSSRSGSDVGDLSLDALAIHHAKKRPGQRPPRIWDQDAIDTVRACLAKLSDRPLDEQRELVRDAIAGGIVRSREGFPTIRFLFGSVEHFLDHADAGKSARFLAVARARQKRAAEERQERLTHDEAHPVASPEEIAALIAAAKLEL